MEVNNSLNFRIKCSQGYQLYAVWRLARSVLRSSLVGFCAVRHAFTCNIYTNALNVGPTSGTPRQATSSKRLHSARSAATMLRVYVLCSMLSSYACWRIVLYDPLAVVTQLQLEFDSVCLFFNSFFFIIFAWLPGKFFTSVSFWCFNSFIAVHLIMVFLVPISVERFDFSSSN